MAANRPTARQVRLMHRLCRDLDVRFAFPPSRLHASIAIRGLLAYRDALDEHPVFARLYDAQLNYNLDHSADRFLAAR